MDPSKRIRRNGCFYQFSSGEDFDRLFFKKGRDHLQALPLEAGASKGWGGNSWKKLYFDANIDEDAGEDILTADVTSREHDSNVDLILAPYDEVVDDYDCEFGCVR